MSGKRRQENFTSYYGRPILNAPTWEARDIASYLFLGGLAGASSMLAAGAEITGRPALARAGKLTAAGAIGLSGAALVHDLGRPSRFTNMLRVLKPTSPMSVGSWLLAAYSPLAATCALTELLGKPQLVGRGATLGAAVVAPAIATYTAVLIADTAVPAWHSAYPELPFLFAGSSLAAASGIGLVAAPPSQAGPARLGAVLGAALEAAAAGRMRRRLGLVGGPYHRGRSGALVTAGEALSLAGACTGASAGRRYRSVAAAGGLGLLVGSALTRFGIFEAGVQSAHDPKYTVIPQRERLDARQPPHELGRDRPIDRDYPAGPLIRSASDHSHP